MQAVFYAGGVLRLIMSDGARFGVSDVAGVEEEGLEVMDESLINMTRSLKSGLVVEIGPGTKYEIDFEPFRIRQYLNGILIAIVNHRDTFYFENPQPGLHTTTYRDSGDRVKIIEDLKANTSECLHHLFQSPHLSDRTLFRYFGLDRYRGALNSSDELMYTDDFK